MSKIEDKVLHGPPMPTAQYQGHFVYRILDLIRAEIADTGDRDWIVDTSGGTSVKLSQIEGVSRAAGAGLHRLGLGPGHTLHLACNSSLDFYWPVFGAWLCGARMSVADPGLPMELIRGQLEDTGASIVVTNAEAAPKFVEAKAQVSHVLVIDRDPGQDLPPGTTSFRALFNDDISKCPPLSSLPPWDPEDGALIHWSSGTSGNPKGILHSQHYLHSMLRPSKLPQGSKSLCSYTCFHAARFFLALDGGINNRFTCYDILEDVYTPSLVLDVIAKYKPVLYMCGTNQALAVANQYQNQNGRDLSSLKVVLPCGGAITSTTESRLRQLFPELSMLLMFYGSTEINGVSVAFDAASQGTLLPGVQVYIRDLTTGERLGPNQEGEIMAKTGTIMKGYLNRPEETQGFLDKEGFAYMNDIGYYDTQGKIYFVDRVKEIMKVSNYHFGPGEIEAVLEEIPQVLEACVWGAYEKDLGDDRIFAALVLAENATLTEEEVRTQIANNLLPSRQLTGKIYFVDSIPHNPTGKKMRRLMKGKYSQK